MKYLPLLVVTALGHFIAKKTSLIREEEVQKSLCRVLWILTLTSILVDILSSFFKFR